LDLAALLRTLLHGGASNLAAYLAAHVILCLVPAFLIAGAMTALIPKEAVTRFLGRDTPGWISYPAAALAGSTLAVCSCTIVPLFAGIYKKGAGLGPAITFLFFAPAANVLALIYTGGVIGVDLALARLLLSLAFGMGIGMIMALLFRREDAARDAADDRLFAPHGPVGIRRPAGLFVLTLLALLLAGTLKIEPFSHRIGEIFLPFAGAQGVQDALNRIVPYDASRGEEGITLQGVMVIGLLAWLAVASWKGIEDIHRRFSGWTWAALGLTAVTLVAASIEVQSDARGISVAMTGRTLGVWLALPILLYLGRRHLREAELRDWLWESWRFVKQIFPLLAVGVFLVGSIRPLIQAEWIEAVAGRNTPLGNLAGVAFGVFMYFPTLVEVPIARMFLDLGMHPGPLLAYLMADPELSLQSILIVSAIIGPWKAWTYVGWVALFSMLAGLLYGAWIDGLGLAPVLGWLGAFLALLALGLRWLARMGFRGSSVAQPSASH